MKISNCLSGGIVLLAIAFVMQPVSANADNPFDIFSRLIKKKHDVKMHGYECDNCGNVCESGDKHYTRTPVKDCAIGKKELFRFKKACEYQTVPETRYYLKDMKVTREIPCPYCAVSFETKNVPHCYGEEEWEKLSDDGAQLHVKRVKKKFENFPTKQCKHEEDETTIKVTYWSCVKVPYTIYRQIKVPIRVKQPYYEKVEVPVTRYLCNDCQASGRRELGRKRCQHQHAGECDAVGCDIVSRDSDD